MDARRGERADRAASDEQEGTASVGSASPLVSVVIPTYDRPSYLRGAIETVLGQTYDSVEIVVVDDGSETDAAVDIVEAYADRPTPIALDRHDENQGPSAARNTGIEAARGDYIAFLDDDDRWHETKLERQMNALQQSDPAVGVVSCRVAAISPAGDLLRAERSKPTGNLWPAILRENVVGTPSRIVVHRSHLEAIGGFDESLPAKQDWDLCIRLARNWHVETLPAVLCYRTIHDGNLSSDPETALEAFAAIREKHEAAIREHDCWDAALANCHATVGIAALFRGRRRTGRKHIRRAVGYQPVPYLFPLYASTFVPGGFTALVETKRWVERRLTRDGPRKLNPDVVPGTRTGSESQWTVREEHPTGESV